MDLSMAFFRRNLAIETVAKSCNRTQRSQLWAKSSQICKVWLTKVRKEVWKLKVSPLNSVRWTVIDTCQPSEKSTKALESRMTFSDACRDRARLSQSMLLAILLRACHHSLTFTRRSWTSTFYIVVISTISMELMRLLWSILSLEWSKWRTIKIH